MKKATNRILSFLTAFAMVIGVLVAPFTSANAAETGGETEQPKSEVTKTVTLHKLVMSKADLEAWKSEDIEKAGYDGSQNTDQLKALLEGKTLNEVAGVYFAFKDKDGYVTIKEGETTEYGRVASLDAQLPEGFKLLAGKTEAAGITFNTSGLKGDFTIEEIHEKSSYVGEEGEAITDSKAVPVKITLPLVNNEGVVEDAHVYPKNTEEKPQIDKNFKKDNKVLTNAEGNFDEYYTDEEKTAGAQTGDINHGADYDNYNKKKLIANGEIGKNIPYEVKTKIPAKSNLKLAKWDDNMSAGLTYNKDLKLTIADKEIKNTEETTYYTIKETDSGFVLRLEEAGLDLVNNKDEAVEVKLVYSATVNSDAIADIPETNDVKFNYGNNPSKETEPVPGKPNTDGELKVEKTWDDGVWAEGESATFELRDAETGRKITADDLVEPEDEAAKAEFKEYKKNFNAEVTIGYPGKDADGKDVSKTSDSWKYLNPDKQYIAVETKSTSPSDVEYVQGEDGTLKATNHKSNNPKPLNPTEPKVVLGGKKFVKTNQDGKERLAGAEFYVKNAEGKYLVADQKDATKVTEAKNALDEAVKAYNALDADKQTDEEKAKVTAAQEAYNKAFKENATAYKWEDANTNAVVLTSDGQGKFEISGLEYGSYKLEEKTAPKGYAKLNGEIDFTVAKDTYKGTAEEFKYEVEVKEGETQTYGKQVPNKKVSIPQTGGIGSLIFIVAGLAIMGVAFVAMKKRNAVEA
ncbi:pilin N-terminal domain-containing protein [Anaerococcus sp. Marseille-Q7828]|uniref:pilin N-terminal domain-containing protein n=1 Tax=Anaerococcus sp. Marseille-Q7828 TaxID=3036300 RepID=UPI0024ACEF7E|nr:pilin N-terminal domain-containing protein [Anaerococcus sp. Marseille-Q7828]